VSKKVALEKFVPLVKSEMILHLQSNSSVGEFREFLTELSGLTVLEKDWLTSIYSMKRQIALMSASLEEMVENWEVSGVRLSVMECLAS